MAKETAHQRKLREFAEQEALEAAKVLSYPHALMTTLARASYPSWENWDNIEALENEMDRIEVERAEARRIYDLRQTALNKLTAEEKEVLGL